MSLPSPHITKIINYTVCDQIYRRSYSLIRFSATKSGIINDSFWNPFENYLEYCGSDKAMEERFRKIFYSLYSRPDIKDVWVSDFASVMKYKDINPEPYPMPARESLTGTINTIHQKHNSYPANTWIIGTVSEKLWIRVPWNVKGFQPGDDVHIYQKNNAIQLLPVESSTYALKWRRKNLTVKESE